MRFTEITIGRKTYPLCYSTKVDLAIETKLGGLAKLGEVIARNANPREKSETLAWAIEKMLEAGARYIALTGGESRTDWPAQGDMLDLLSMSDMMTAVIACIKAGSEREVDVEPPKNAETTGGV